MSSKLEKHLTCTENADDSCPFFSRLSILTVVMAIHDEAHLEHGNCNGNGWRHILVREDTEGRDFRIIDFDHATAHECERRMAIKVDDYEPSPKDFGCREIYDAVQYLDLWTPCESASLAIVSSCRLTDF